MFTIQQAIGIKKVNTIDELIREYIKELTGNVSTGATPLPLTFDSVNQQLCTTSDVSALCTPKIMVREIELNGRLISEIQLGNLDMLNNIDELCATICSNEQMRLLLDDYAMKMDLAVEQTLAKQVDDLRISFGREYVKTIDADSKYAPIRSLDECAKLVDLDKYLTKSDDSTLTLNNGLEGENNRKLTVKPINSTAFGVILEKPQGEVRIANIGSGIIDFSDNQVRTQNLFVGGQSLQTVIRTDTPTDVVRTDYSIYTAAAVDKLVENTEGSLMSALHYWSD